MAYTPTVEFVWLPAATSPGPVLPPLASRFPTASSADAAIHRSSGLRNLWRERFEGTSGGKVDCVAALATTGGAVPPGFLCRILGSRRALAQARTKSEPYAVHGIYVYSGIRVAAGGEFAGGRPRPLKIQFLPKQPTPSPLFTAPATRHRGSPFSCRACSCSQRSEADAGPMRLLPSL